MYCVHNSFLVLKVTHLVVVEVVAMLNSMYCSKCSSCRAVDSTIMWHISSYSKEEYCQRDM